MTYIHPDPARGLAMLLDGAEVAPGVTLTTGLHLPIDERGITLSDSLPFAELRLTPAGSAPGPRMAREVQVSVHGAEHQSMNVSENILTFLGRRGLVTPEGVIDHIAVDQLPHHMANGPLMVQGVWTCAFTLICRTRGKFVTP